MSIRRLELATLAGAALLASCSSAQPTTSTVTGSIAQATFPSPVTRVTVVSDTGARSTVAVDAADRFRIVLAEGASYRLFLSDGEGTPLVVRSENGRLETALAITSGGASADIGAVRYWRGTPKTRSRALSSTLSMLPASAGPCHDGFIEGTSEPCASGTAGAVCADEGKRGHCHGGHGHHAGEWGEHADEQGEHEDEQGGHADEGSDARADQPMGVPEMNLPASIGCGDHHGRRHHDHDEDEDEDEDD